MRAIFLGRKPAAATALRHLVDAGVEVVMAIAPTPPTETTRDTFWRPLLRDTARELGIPTMTDTELYQLIENNDSRPEMDLGNIDIVVSFLFWKKIRSPLIALPRIGCFNFHPAPLPEFRGRRGYNFAILEGHERYGASVHWVSEGLDEGNLVEVREFPIQPEETAFSLEHRTMRCLLEMFDDFISRILHGETVPSTPQGPGRTATKEQLLAAMEVRPDDAPAVVARKVRAFWYPPHTGATIRIGDATYTLIDEVTLSKLGRYLHGSRNTPW